MSAREPVFFLSYAHSAPSTDLVVAKTEVSVRDFFNALSEEVASQSGLPYGAEVGFVDQNIHIGANWAAAITSALGTAEVFVPLYSPGYFNKSVPMRELKSFQRRLAITGAPEPRRHIIPVLWTPFAPWEMTEDVSQAMNLAEDIPEYAENGMRALCMLNVLRAPYEQVVKRLAEQIVDCATHHAIGPAKNPNAIWVPETKPRDTQFIVAVIAPSQESPPVGRQTQRYGPEGKLWRPFAERQELPIADYAASTAERLGSATVVDGFAKVRELLAKRPAVVLIDPWIIRTPGGKAALIAAAQELEPWVAPLLVIDGDDPVDAKQSADLANAVSRLMSSAGVRAVKQVNQLDKFVAILPRLITQARSQYLKHGPVTRPPGQPTERPTLRGKDVPPPTNGKVD